MFNLLKLGHVEEFPQECYERIYQIIKTGLTNGGFTGVKNSIKDNLFEFTACCFSILSWFVGGLQKDKPIIGATGPAHEAIGKVEKGMEEICLQLEAEANVKGPQIPMGASGVGFLRELAVKRLLGLAVSYLLATLNDSDQIEEYLKQFQDWLGEQLNG